MTLVELPDARDAVLALAQRLDAEEVALADAHARVLAEDVVAHEAIPSFDSSAMDGYAVRAADVAGACAEAPARLRVVAESRAGAPAAARLGAGETIAISTGAAMPDGADAVVRVEDTATVDGVVEMLTSVELGWDVRHAGEDVRPGETVLRAGTRLGPAALGVLASLGRSTIACVRRPRVALISTGDELLDVGEQSRVGAVRDSNSHTLGALIRSCGAALVSSARAPDDADATRALIGAATDGVDAVVICGGMSVGVHDHVRASLDALGAKTVFWGLALKPGKPMWFGTLSDTLVFGLPGNPVSAYVTFTLLVARALHALEGAAAEQETATAVLDFDYEKHGDRAHALRCALRLADDGWHATPTGPQGSHILTSLLGADALAIVPTATTTLRAGARVEIVRLGETGGSRA